MFTNQNSGIQMSEHILAEKYAFSNNWMYLKGLLSIYKRPSFLCKGLNVDDIFDLYTKNENLFNIYKKCSHFSEKCQRTRFTWFMAFIMSVSTQLPQVLFENCTSCS